jgi:hypothetical protein
VKNVDGGDDEPESRFLGSGEPSEAQNDASFVLFDDSNRGGKKYERQDNHDCHDDED